MPTNKPRLSVVLELEELRLIEQYQRTNQITSLSKAATELILKGLSKYSDTSRIQQVYTKDEMDVLRALRNANEEGRQMIYSAIAQAKSKTCRKIWQTSSNASVEQISADHLSVIFNHYFSLSKEEQEKFIISLDTPRKPIEEILDAADVSEEKKA